MIDFRLVDAHTHLGPIVDFRYVSVHVEDMLSLMDFLGIDLAIQMHSAGFAGLFREALEASEAAFDHSQGRLYYAPVYHAHYSKENLTWIRKAVRRPGCVGLKIHPSFNRLYADDQKFEGLWELAAEWDLPIVSHSWAPSDHNPVQKFSFPDYFEPYVARYPQVTLILAHAGGLYAGHLAAVKLVQRYANVHLDISGDCFSFKLIDWLVERVGAERILYGSDTNWIDPRTTLGRVLDADITLEQKRLILGDNAFRLFRKLNS
jgi:predicted TIM-barrel fold metal-dependent hydrolase